jgi:hypothetical protein
VVDDEAPADLRARWISMPVRRRLRWEISSRQKTEVMQV